MLFHRVFRRFISSFSEINQQSLIANLKKSPLLRLNTKEPPTKKAAVLIPLCICEGKVSLLYTLRSAFLTHHGRQVSFPGGIMDPDETHEACAVRETWEETGIPQTQISVWGTGQILVPYRASNQEQIEIMPVVGRLTEDFEKIQFSLNAKEVEEIFTVPLERLIKDRQHTQFRTRGGYSTPLWVLDRPANVRIWGMTAVLTHHFLCALFTEENYSRKIPYIRKIRNS